MTPEQWWGAALFMLVSSITPGPNNAMLMASGVHFGYRRTLAHLMGVQLGFGFMLIAVGLGLHAVLSQFPAFYDVVRFAGGAYMVWMAWSLASARPQLAANTAQGASGYGATQAFEDEVCQPQAVASAAKQSKDYDESSKPGLPPRAATSEAVPTQATTAQSYDEAEKVKNMHLAGNRDKKLWQTFFTWNNDDNKSSQLKMNLIPTMRNLFLEVFKYAYGDELLDRIWEINGSNINLTHFNKDCWSFTKDCA